MLLANSDLDFFLEISPDFVLFIKQIEGHLIAFYFHFLFVAMFALIWSNVNEQLIEQPNYAPS